MTELRFVVYGTPTPQGSMKAFIVKGKDGKQHANVTSDNPNLKSFRQEVAIAALLALSKISGVRPLFSKHVPVVLEVAFYFRKPKSVSKKRTEHVVKPDLSKLLRAVEDAMTGIIWNDDAQVVEEHISKHYDGVERAEIVARAGAEQCVIRSLTEG